MPAFLLPFSLLFSDFGLICCYLAFRFSWCSSNHPHPCCPDSLSMLIFHPVIPVMGENTVHLFDSWKKKQQIIRPMQLHIRRFSMCSFEQRGEIKTLARRLRIELGGHLMALLSSGKNGCAFVESFCCLFSIALTSALLFSPSISLGFILSFCLFSNFLYQAHTATPICP